MVVVVGAGATGVLKLVTVAFEYDRLISRGKYIFRLVTGSALASVDAATSAATKSDFVCILPFYQRVIRIGRREVVC